MKLKKREDELQLSITELEAKVTKLNESSSQTLQVLRIEDGISSIEEDNRKIFDTGELPYLDNRTVSIIQENDLNQY